MNSVYRDIQENGWHVRLNLSGQVLELEVPEFELYPRSVSESLSPTLPDVQSRTVSAASLLLKAKQFDDGLYSAVDLAAQTGAGHFAGKAQLLRSLGENLSARPPSFAEAAAIIYAACELGRVEIPVPPSLQDLAHNLAGEFLHDERASKPLGFYTWTPELSAIFRQDRFLQQPLTDDMADDLAFNLDATPGIAAIYDDCLRLNARLTNPSATPGLRGRQRPRSFFPASRSHEQAMVERLYGDRPVPENFDLMNELISRIRSGEISLEPKDGSGWYDYQTWSIEPLVVPERMPEVTHLTLGNLYRKCLEDVFRGALALTRETHVKQLAVALAGCKGPPQPPIYVRPELTVEPLPTLYARKAASYRFIRSVLEQAFGTATLETLRGRTQERLRELPLLEELMFLEKLFDGAAATARRELGIDPQPNDTADALWFTHWSANIATDQDVSRDCRIMVPVFFDRQRQRTKVWAFLGWRPVCVDASYTTNPEVVCIEPDNEPEAERTDRLSVLRRKFRKQSDLKAPEPPSIIFCGDSYLFAAPVIVETYVSRLLDRDEFRAHCDHYRTKDSILSHLQ